MRGMKKFQSIYIDLEKDIYKVNGETIPEFTKELNLSWTPDNGWELELSIDKVYLSQYKIKA